MDTIPPLSLPILLDGATGSELYKRGMPAGAYTEQWVLGHPEALLELQRGYVAAGSQVLIAPTFGANRVRLEQHGIFGQVADYNRRLVELSRQAAGGRALVAGDMAPTGLFIAPFGESSFEELVAIYTEQAAALAAAGVDLFLIETTMTMPEARAAVLACKSVSDRPVWVTFTCDENGRTLSGTDVLAALIVMQGMGVDAFGLNCSSGPAEMLEQMRRLTPYTTVPLIAKPNAGLPETVEGQAVYHCPPEEFASYTWPYYLSTRPDYRLMLQNSSLMESSCPFIADRLAAMKMESVQPYELLTALPEASKQQFYRMAKFDYARFAGLFDLSPKKNLIIIGTRHSSAASEQQQAAYVERIIQQYGSDYDIFFKPHPADSSSAGYPDRFEGLTLLPGQMPFEIFVWALLDKIDMIGGYPSTTFISVPLDKVGFLFAADADGLVRPLNILFRDAASVEWIQ